MIFNELAVNIFGWFVSSRYAGEIKSSDQFIDFLSLTLL